MLNSEKPRNLLILTTDSVIAGTERMILAYLERHDPSKYKPTLATLTGPGDLIDEARRLGIEGYHLDCRSPFGATFRLRGLLRKVRPDIVHSYLFHTNILSRFLRPFCRIPKLICGMRSVYFPGAYPGWYHRLDGFTRRLCEGFIANSYAGKRSLVQMAGIPAEKIDVVPNGIDIQRFERDRATNREWLVKEFSLPEDAFVFGIVAQLRPRKHHALLFRSLQTALRTEPSIYLLVIGDGPEYDRLKRLQEKLGLESHVTMAGYRAEIPEILAGLDAFVLPTSLEGSPVSVMEAMVSGLPVIVANAGGVVELIEDGKTGLLVEPQDENELTQAMLRLAHDPQLRRRIGENAKERIRSEYSFEEMARRIEAVYDKVMGEKSRGSL